MTMGAAPTGVTYITSILVPNPDIPALMAQMKSIATDSGMKVTAERYVGKQGQLLLTPAKGLAIFVAVSENGRIAVGSKPGPGQAETADTIRTSLCTLLGKVNTKGAEAASPSVPADTSRTSAPEADSRTAPPVKQQRILRPASTFDAPAAKLALEPGTATIRGTACTRHSGNLFLASNQHVYLYPATPYLEEWIKLMQSAKPGRDRLEIDPAVASTRMDGKTNAQGQFQFARMKIGRYYLVTTLSSAVSGVSDVSTGSAMTGQDEITFYHELIPYQNNYNDVLEKYVDVSREGQSMDITLSSRIKVGSTLLAGIKKQDGHAGIFGCSSAWFTK